MQNSPRLVLFDVDGTLLLGNRRLRGWFEEALIEVFGQAGDIDGHSFSGKIDPQIVCELLTAAGVPAERIEARLQQVKRAYLGRLERHLRAEDLRLLPHVVRLLERLQKRGEVTLGLLTGNWETGARSKLECFDLNRFFPFGAFSDGQKARSDLPPRALREAKRHTGETFCAQETVIVGDSLLDIECAHQNGMRAVAVATGYTSRSELQNADADWTLEDLGEIAEVHPVFRN